MALTNEIIEKKFNDLPDTLAAVVMDPETFTRVSSIGRINGLNDSQVDALESVISLVLTGIIHIDDLELNIQKNTQLEPQRVAGLVFELKKQLLNKYTNELREIGNKITATDIEQYGTKEQGIQQPATPNAPAASIQPSIAQAKLSQITTMPRPQVVPPTNLPTQPQPQNQEPIEKKTYTGPDPYREAPTA